MLHGRKCCHAARDAGTQLILGLAVSAPGLRLCRMSNKLVSIAASCGRKRPSILALWVGVASDPHKVCEIWSRLSHRHVQTKICRGMVWIKHDDVLPPSRVALKQRNRMVKETEPPRRRWCSGLSRNGMTLAQKPNQRGRGAYGRGWWPRFLNKLIQLLE